MNKRYLLLLVFLTVLFVTVSKSKAEPLSLGVIIGTENGLSFKYNLENSKAIAGAISYSTFRDYGSSVHVDYLFDKARQLEASQGSSFDFYYGLGVQLSNIRRGLDEGRTQLGLRGPFGLSKSIYNPNLDFFGEVVPILQISPNSDVNLAVGLGLRYRF
jgi:hypothetical protein